MLERYERGDAKPPCNLGKRSSGKSRQIVLYGRSSNCFGHGVPRTFTQRASRHQIRTWHLEATAAPQAPHGPAPPTLPTSPQRSSPRGAAHPALVRAWSRRLDVSGGYRHSGQLVLTVERQATLDRGRLQSVPNNHRKVAFAFSSVRSRPLGTLVAANCRDLHIICTCYVYCAGHNMPCSTIYGLTLQDSPIQGSFLEPADTSSKVWGVQQIGSRDFGHCCHVVGVAHAKRQAGQSIRARSRKNQLDTTTFYCLCQKDPYETSQKCLLGGAN